MNHGLRPIEYNGKKYIVQAPRRVWSGMHQWTCDAFEVLPNGRTRVVMGQTKLDTLARLKLGLGAETDDAAQS